jgi:hypothetical protein
MLNAPNGAGSDAIRPLLQKMNIAIPTTPEDLQWFRDLMSKCPSVPRSQKHNERRPVRTESSA